MKTKSLVWGLVVLVSFVVGAAGYGAEVKAHGFYKPKTDEEIYGTWINKDMTGGRPRKVVYNYWGGWEGYALLTDTNPMARGTSILVDKWTDAEGAVWYKEYWRGTIDRTGVFCLVRISGDGTRFEWIEDIFDWPARGDLVSKKVGARYGVYYREEVKPEY